MTHTQNVIKHDLVYVHDLGEDALKALQGDAARHHGIPVEFSDVTKDFGQGPDMVVIPAGMYEMGAPGNEYGFMPEEGPQHYVGIAQDFAIGKYTIKAEEFEVFRRDTGWQLRRDLIWAKEGHPVINIRIADAMLYAQWLSEQTGAIYRLPTEAEWEYAARAGSITAFTFGDTVSCREVHFNAAFPYEEARQEKRWFMPRCFPMPKAIKVGSKPPSRWGLHEVHGNVWEFTETPWSNSHVDNRRDGRSRDHQSEWMVTKGGSWFDAAIWSRSAARKPRLRDELDVNLGFRLVRELQA